MPSLKVQQEQIARKTLSHKGRGKVGRGVGWTFTGDAILPEEVAIPREGLLATHLVFGAVKYPNSYTTPLRKAPRTRSESHGAMPTALQVRPARALSRAYHFDSPSMRPVRACSGLP